MNKKSEFDHISIRLPMNGYLQMCQIKESDVKEQIKDLEPYIQILLEKNGNEVKRLHFEKLIHGFVNLTNIRKADVATIKIFETMKGYLN